MKQFAVQKYIQDYKKTKTKSWRPENREARPTALQPISVITGRVVLRHDCKSSLGERCTVLVLVCTREPIFHKVLVTRTLLVHVLGTYATNFNDYLRVFWEYYKLLMCICYLHAFSTLPLPFLVPQTSDNLVTSVHG